MGNGEGSKTASRSRASTTATAAFSLRRSKTERLRKQLPQRKIQTHRALQVLRRGGRRAVLVLGDGMQDLTHVHGITGAQFGAAVGKTKFTKHFEAFRGHVDFFQAG